MTKKLLWFACLGLLCLGAFALVVNATNSDRVPSAVSHPAVSNTVPAEKAPSLAETNGKIAVEQAAVGSMDAAYYKPAMYASYEEEIAALEAHLYSVSATETVVPMALKERLNELYSMRPANRARSLDQGADACPATVISSVPYTDTGTTVGYVNNYTTCIANSAPDVIYQFTPTTSASYIVSLCGSGYDTALEVRYGGSCPGTTQLACNDDFCGLQSQVTVALTAGTTYFIIVDGYSSSSGTYTLNVTSQAACDIVCQGGDIIEPTENRTDTTFYRTDPTGGCNNSPTPFFGNLNCGQTACGRIFTYLGPGGANYRDTDWWLFTIANPCTVRVTVNSEQPALFGIVRNVSPCASPAFVVNSTTTGNCVSNTVTAICLAAGTYAVFVAPTVFTGMDTPTDYRATLTCSAPCAACQFDATINAPGSWASTTCGALDDCNLRTGEDRIVRVVIPTAGQWTFSLCEATYYFDTYMYVTTACCGGTTLASNDDGCTPNGLQSIIQCLQLAAGTYYVDIEPFSSGACGNFTLSVTQCAPCDITCQPGDVNELTENPADTTFYRTDPTGGCNSDPDAFQNITCGQTVCGNTFTYLGPGGSQYRDTDWYLFTIANPCTVQVSLRSEYLNMLFGIVNGVPTCTAPAFVVSGTTSFACSTGTVQAICLGAGTYAMFVAPNAFSGVDTPLQYRATLTCSAPCAPCVPDYVVNAPGTLPQVSTCGAGDNCNLRAGEDYTIQINIPTTGNYTIRFCLPDGVAWDSYAYITTQCCGGTILYTNDDGCNDNSTGFDDPLFACVNLAAGTYFVDFEPYSNGTCGPMLFEITQCGVCDITCQPGDVIECTEVFDSTHADLDCNGGCNNTIPTYQTLTCGQTVCGRMQTYIGPGGGEYRDTDWYQVVLTQQSFIRWKVRSETATSVFILDANDCDNILVLTSGSIAVPCDSLELVSDCLNPGTYVVWAGPSNFTGVPLSDYRGTLTCVPCAPCDVVGQPGDIPEGEPVCGDEYNDTYNGGCNSLPPVFAPAIVPGQAVFGEYGTFLFGGNQYRDTDWIPITITTACTLNYYAVGEAATLTYILGPGPQGYECDSLRILSTAGLGGPCQEIQLSIPCVTPGTYWLFIATQAFSGVACGSDWRIWTTCNACCDINILADQVTVYPNAGYTNLVVRFNAPVAGDYAIYSSTAKDDTVPATPEATVSVPAGTAVWTDPGAILPYKRYIVRHLCP